MKVLKRDGRIEDFDIKKIMYTIARVSDDLDSSLTQGDLDFLEHELMQMIVRADVDPISTKAIHYMVLVVLRGEGFRHFAEAYDKHEGSRIRDDENTCEE